MHVQSTIYSLHHNVGAAASFCFDSSCTERTNKGVNRPVGLNLAVDFNMRYTNCPRKSLIEILGSLCLERGSLTAAEALLHFAKISTFRLGACLPLCLGMPVSFAIHCGQAMNACIDGSLSA